MMRRAEGCFVPTPARVGDGRLCAKVPKTSQYPPIPSNTLDTIGTICIRYHAVCIGTSLNLGTVPSVRYKKGQIIFSMN